MSASFDASLASVSASAAAADATVSQATELRARFALASAAADTADATAAAATATCAVLHTNLNLQRVAALGVKGELAEAAGRISRLAVEISALSRALFVTRASLADAPRILGAAIGDGGGGGEGSAAATGRLIPSPTPVPAPAAPTAPAAAAAAAAAAFTAWVGEAAPRGDVPPSSRAYLADLSQAELAAVLAKVDWVKVGGAARRKLDGPPPATADAYDQKYRVWLRIKGHYLPHAADNGVSILIWRAIYIWALAVDFEFDG